MEKSIIISIEKSTKNRCYEIRIKKKISFVSIVIK